MYGYEECLTMIGPGLTSRQSPLLSRCHWPLRKCHVVAPMCSSFCKAVLVTGHGGPWCCEASRLPQLLYSLLTDGCEVVSLMHRPPLTSRKIPGTHSCYRLSRPKGFSAAGRIKSMEKSNNSIRNRTHNFPGCNRVLFPLYSYKTKQNCSIIVP
jgi:hypothetical protein